MVFSLLALTTFQLLLAQVENTKEQQTYIVLFSILACFFYCLIIKNLFASKNIKLKLIVTVALVSFIGNILSTPKLSFDLYRYFWDGLLVKNSLNPYDYVPSDWKLHDLQEENMTLYKKVDWKDKFTPYPPLAQYIFALSHSFYDIFGLSGGKFILSLPFLLSALLLYLKFDKKIFAAFILNPLILIETVANAHIDGWIVFLMLLGIYLYGQKKYLLFSFVLALAVLVKIYPIFFVPFFALDLLRKRKTRELAISLLIGTITLLIFYFPFIQNSFFAITRYIDLPQEQEYNASIYRYLYQFFGKDNPASYARASMYSGIIFLIGYFFLLTRKFSYKILFSVGLLYLLCSPIAFPWYWTFLIPFLLIIAQESQDDKVLLLTTVMQATLMSIYFEPGNFIQRNFLLNFEYALLLTLLVVYNKSTIQELVVYARKRRN